MAVSINPYNQLLKIIGDGTCDMNGDTFDIILMNDTHAFDATDTLKTDIGANEIPSGNGYTQGAEVLASVTYDLATAVVTWDAADTVWSASGGPIPTSGNCSDAVIYDETATQVIDALLFSIDFGQLESAGSGTDFRITYNGSGIFTIT